MVNKAEKTELQLDMRKRNNKPGSKAIGPQDAKAIREGKHIVRTQD